MLCAIGHYLYCERNTNDCLQLHLEERTCFSKQNLSINRRITCVRPTRKQGRRFRCSDADLQETKAYCCTTLQTNLRIRIACRQLGTLVSERRQPGFFKPLVILAGIGARDDITADGRVRIFNNAALAVGEIQQTAYVPICIDNINVYISAS